MQYFCVCMHRQQKWLFELGMYHESVRKSFRSKLLGRNVKCELSQPALVVIPLSRAQKTCCRDGRMLWNLWSQVFDFQHLGVSCLRHGIVDLCVVLSRLPTSMMWVQQFTPNVSPLSLFILQRLFIIPNGAVRFIAGIPTINPYHWGS